MSKFGDISSRKSADADAVSQIVNAGQVKIKEKKKASSREQREPLQVMLRPDVKRGIKAMAAMHGISMTELFEKMYTHYVNTKK